MLRAEMAPAKRLRAEAAEACVERLTHPGPSRAERIGLTFEKYDGGSHTLSLDGGTLQSTSRFSFQPAVCNARLRTGCHRWAVSVTTPNVSVGVTSLRSASTGPQVCAAVAQARAGQMGPSCGAHPRDFGGVWPGKSGLRLGAGGGGGAHGRQRQQRGWLGQPTPSLPGARATPAQPASGGGCLPQPRWAVCATGAGAHQGQTNCEGGKDIWWTARTARGGTGHLEPSSWRVGTVLDVAWCAVCVSAAPNNWRIEDVLVVARVV